MHSESAEPAGSAAEQAFEAARSQLSASLEAVQGQARAMADEQKRMGADQLSGLAAAAHHAADDVEPHNPAAAEYIRKAADSLEEASKALRERSFGELIEAFNGFARNRPVALFAGALVAGFALSRLLGSPAGGRT